MTELLQLISEMWRGIRGSGAASLSGTVGVRDIAVNTSIFTTPWISWLVFLYTTGHREWRLQLFRLKPQLQQLPFPGAYLTHLCVWGFLLFTVNLIQHVSASSSVSVWQTLPFSLCVVQPDISLGYPPPDLNKTTSWWKLWEALFFMMPFPCTCFT